MAVAGEAVLDETGTSIAHVLGTKNEFLDAFTEIRQIGSAQSICRTAAASDWLACADSARTLLPQYGATSITVVISESSMAISSGVIYGALTEGGGAHRRALRVAAFSTSRCSTAWSP